MKRRPKTSIPGKLLEIKRSGRLLCLGLVVMACFCLMAERAFGQGNTWAGDSLARMVEAARWRLGLLRVNAAFQLTNAGYDSDIYYGYLGEPVSDLTVSAGTPVQLLVPAGKKVVLEVFDNPQYAFFLDTRNERTWNNVSSGAVHIALERVYIQGGGGYSSIRRRLSPELDINFREKESNWNGLLLWQASRAVSFAITADESAYDYGDASFAGTNLAEILNRKEDHFDLIAYLQPSSRVRLFLDGQHGRYSFTEDASGTRDTRSYSVFGGIEFVQREGETRRTEGLQGTLRLGYKRFDVLDPLSADGTGIAGEARVSLGLFARTTARLFFSNDYQFSAYSSRTFYVVTTFGGGITRLLSRRASLSYEALISRIDYPDPGPDGGGVQGVDFNSTSHMFGLDIRLARLLRITLIGTLGARRQNDAGSPRHRNFFGLNLIYGVSRGAVTAPTRAFAR